ncbi:MAG TPA: DUF4184 family protein [Terracidiphilus sp.]|nr:DUF4184 family protein [Terracidiphilus sp.]
MPFTASHAAAALPLRRSRLVFPAVVIGSFAPDLEYFLRLSPGGGWGHTLMGALALSLPLGLAVLWLFYRFAWPPIVALLPVSIERRLGCSLQPFGFRGRVLLIVLSMLAGIATHLAWDSFTHIHTWLYFHCSFLRQDIPLPLVGPIRSYFLLQILSSVAGILALLFWFFRWYRDTPPGPQPLGRTFTPWQKAVIVIAMLTLSTAGGLLRAFLQFGIPQNRHTVTGFAGDTAVTVGALLWWQLIAWGVLFRSRVTSFTAHSEPIHR